MSNQFLDKNGERVVHFAADVRTLGKIGELADKIIEMAESGAWRRYRTAVGVDEWRECEFDYFLISCDVAFDDVYRAIKWHRLGEQTREKMDPNAPPAKRRTLEQAAAKWHAPTAETLVERAARNGWIPKTNSAKPSERKQPARVVRSPLSKRQRSKQAAGGKSWEERARERRQERISAKRRRELDRLAAETLIGLPEHERRYLLDALAEQLARKAGRPTGDHEQWAKDIAELDGDTKALAERWGVDPIAVRQRKTTVRKHAGKITVASDG
jgi:hypothetical protein